MNIDFVLLWGEDLWSIAGRDGFYGLAIKMANVFGRNLVICIITEVC